jgi:phosphopentomutase
MGRAVLLVLDSLGIGAAPDAPTYGDAGADTLGAIAHYCAEHRAAGPLRLPNLSAIGLGLAAELATGEIPPGLGPAGDPIGLWGAAAEVSKGKDTPSGHWEMAGQPVTEDWGYFRQPEQSFPAALIGRLMADSGIDGVLGNCHASGTEIIEALGADHIRSGKPIVYTSADSVFQIAAHEEHFGLHRLYDVCEVARKLVDDYHIGRVIARPFVGEQAGAFRRTGNRRDYATPPPAPTLLDRMHASGRATFSVGKIGDIFAHRHVGEVLKADGNDALFDATLDALSRAGDGDLVFTNFVDFDMLYGHRRDVEGYARALERFDERWPGLAGRLGDGDRVFLTADHGCDPTWPGSDHTREFVPVLAFGPGLAPRALGRLTSFADIGQSIARHLGLQPLPNGTAFL